MSHVELKALETRKNNFRKKLASKKDRQAALSKDINDLMREIRDVESIIEAIKIGKLENNSITITEHAILRYLERVKGIDIEAIKKDIVTEEVLKQIKTLGAGIYPVKGRYHNIDKSTFMIRVRDNAVITVLTKG